MTKTESGRSLLLIDDEDGFLAVMRRRFERRGYDVATAGSGAEALRLLRERRFEAAVLDLKMGDMDGFELLRIFRRMAPEMPVVMLTGHGGETEAAEGLRLGAAGYLLKPCDFEALVECLDGALTQDDSGGATDGQAT
ncbi:response regulator [Nitratidesulfovibrio vulgaris]|jgi:DNA-binding response OmpR family regulator|uniref:Response regulator n=2 Tax=Nitratidesulfovibrio vulgaris TaxID=881 RepID=Q72FS3_NITV2|nr:response regulator [Nitratidesulfovibrio vulgaris]HBW14668.1 response regulator [Desulfovibrio sp.]AAS94624.1 response regulator [Nitratidesulfovibrio vulgaris str. Hildenborough]ABM29838.1 response regulator receiver protein [Nitratidesulfovibrio vulgaris DP4]ADP85336.1 response regulator receiver protein [Nitratidesulfovibrio vulgaris RCH1]WCB46881.1 response regulator [Nitratidesulfovibrio vulgaris]